MPGERLSLNHIFHGAKTVIAPDEMREFYLFQMPISGAASIQNGADGYVTDPGRAALLNPHRATAMIRDGA